MGDISRQDGFNAGRNGSDPNPPSKESNPLDWIVGIGDEAKAQMNKDYMEGYAMGTQQRLADALEDDDD